MNAPTLALLAMGTILLLVLAVVFRAPEAVTRFVRRITKSRFGLGGFEFIHNLNEAAEKNSASSAAHIRESLRAVPVTGRLLWVDDHPENNVAEMNLLRLRGIAVDVAAGNAGAMDLVRRRKYDAVISDIVRNDPSDPRAGLHLPSALGDALSVRPIVIFYTSHLEEIAIDRTRTTSSPEDLFAAIAEAMQSGAAGG